MRRVTVVTAATGILSVAAFVAATLHPATARAEQAAAEEGGLEEVVITAQKRTEKLEDVAVAASVVSSETIAKMNAGDISDLNRLVPSVQLNGTINGRVPLGVRGISSVSNEGTVGLSSGVNIMIDGVSVPSDSRAGNALEDVQSIEVLKGPQQTLGGRTAAAGEINIVTRQPTDTFEGSVTASATTDAEYRANGYVSGPITSAIDYSLAAYITDRKFPIQNIQLDRNTTQHVGGFRGKLLFKPTENLDIKVGGHFGEDYSDGFNFVYTHVTPGVQLLCGVACPPYYPSQSQLLGGITPSMTNLQYSSPINVYSHAKDQDANVDIEYRLGSLTLASTTAYQHEIQTNVQDLFAVSSFFWNVLTQGNAPPFFNIQTQQEDIKQLSQEFKLVSGTDQPFSYLIGAFYSDTKIGYVASRALLPALNDVSVSPDTKTIDLYARSTWRFTPSTSLITGLRYNHDQISYSMNESAYTISFPPPNIVGGLTASDSSSEGTAVGDVSIQQQFADRVMGYFTYSRGYSPAAYNTAQALTPANPQLGSVQKEDINHFELGSKGSYFDNRITLNVALFDTKYKNFQVQIFDQSNISINPPLILTNAGGAETRGLEVDTAWAPTNLTRIDLNAAYINAKFTDYNGAPCYYPTSVATLGTTPAGCYAVVKVIDPTTTPPTTSVTQVQNLSGVSMPNSPKLKFSLSVEQKGPLTNSLDFVFDGNYTWRSHAQMLVDQNPYGIQGSFGILNLSAGVADKNGKYTVTAFVNNVFDRVYYTDIEDFWSSPWGGSANVVGQPARDSKTFGGIRVNFKL